MRRRLLVSYLVVTSLVLLAVLVPSAATYRRRLYDDERAAMQREAYALAALAEDRLEDRTPIDLGPVQRAVARAATEPGAAVVVADRHGRVVARAGPRVADGAAARSRAQHGVVASSTTDARFTVAVPIGSGGRVFGVTEISRPTQSVDDRVHRYWVELGVIGGIALAVVLAIGVVLARGVSAPLERLRAVATRLGEGDLSARAETDDGPGELRDLANDLNRTADRLEQLVNAQADFVGDVSHQLRTPLTAIRLRLENLESSGARSEDAEAALAELERASRLIDGLLALAKADGGAGAVPRPQTLDLRALADERVLGWLPLADELGVHIRVAPGPDAPVVADPERAGQVIDNLIANALDAAMPAGTVDVVIEPRSGRTELHVIDDGRGLTDEDRARAFDRFWRGGDGAASATELGGSGLGLAIVARLAATDGGSSRLDRAPTGGIDAVVTWLSPGRG
ncbi:MAG: HAMP domain-containing histidine kinase [Acidimicrobiia bacterium]|nr:HAMP domain-containing histidine kinase [Acidimicrobiia bacterium]